MCENPEGKEISKEIINKANGKCNVSAMSNRFTSPLSRVWDNAGYKTIIDKK